MSEKLRSVGLDVGTTSTQLIFSELVVENQAGCFSVPEMVIGERKILYKSPVHFTPLLDESHVDAPALREIIDGEYEKAGIRREDVDTGAIIITGETSRKENARAVLEQMAGYAGDFVVATAGPDLESVLAAKGAGADRYSERTGKQVLHMDIGGGTSNLALIEDGKIVRTGCLNVGGRLLKFDKSGKVTYVSPVLEGLCTLRPGQRVIREEAAQVARVLAEALEMAAGLRERTQLLDRLWTRESGSPWSAGGEDVVISFSGGVADCIARDIPWLEFGDMGPVLGQEIRKSRLCGGGYVLGSETIRATVIGAGCHSAQLSGSTVFFRNVEFPLKNLPVISVSREQQEMKNLPELLRQELKKQEGPAVIALPGLEAPGYAQVQALAQKIADGWEDGPVLICLEQDMAKALGQALAVRFSEERPILCIDRVKLGEGSYLDVGAPVGPALPVVVKTLVLSG